MSNTFIVLSLAELNPINWIDGLNPANWEVIKNISEALKALATVCDYLLHPTKILISIWNFTWEISYLICLCTALVALILYAMGFKKYAKLVPGSTFVFLVIRAIGKII